MEFTDRERRLLAELERELTGGQAASPAVSAVGRRTGHPSPAAQPPTRSMARAGGAKFTAASRGWVVIHADEISGRRLRRHRP